MINKTFIFISSNERPYLNITRHAQGQEETLELTRVPSSASEGWYLLSTRAKEHSSTLWQEADTRRNAFILHQQFSIQFGTNKKHIFLGMDSKPSQPKKKQQLEK